MPKSPYPTQIKLKMQVHIQLHAPCFCRNVPKHLSSIHPRLKSRSTPQHLPLPCITWLRRLPTHHPGASARHLSISWDPPSLSYSTSSQPLFNRTCFWIISHFPHAPHCRGPVQPPTPSLSTPVPTLSSGWLEPPPRLPPLSTATSGWWLLLFSVPETLFYSTYSLSWSRPTSDICLLSHFSPKALPCCPMQCRWLQRKPVAPWKWPQGQLLLSLGSLSSSTLLGSHLRQARPILKAQWTLTLLLI